MAEKPYWLDEYFKKTPRGRDAVRDALVNSKSFVQALDRAMMVYHEQDDRFRKDPKLRDKTPEQAASDAFVDALRRT
jgi:hypothetical protein